MMCDAMQWELDPTEQLSNINNESKCYNFNHLMLNKEANLLTKLIGNGKYSYFNMNKYNTKMFSHNF